MSFMRRIMLIALAVLLAQACQDPPPHGLTVGKVHPTVVDPNTTTSLAISGVFYLTPHVSFVSNNQTSLPVNFGATLGDHALAGVTYQSTTQLQATVPQGLPAGTYPLTVTAPDGAQATLNNAVVVLPPIAPACTTDCPVSQIKASLAVQPRAGDSNTVFTANAAGTTAPPYDPNQLTYAWDWQSDGVFDSVGIIATHRYSKMGAYKITLAVTDPSGQRSDSSLAVIVVNLGGLIVVEPQAGDTGGTALRQAFAQAQSASGPTTIASLEPQTLYLTEPLVIPANPNGISLIANGLVLDGNGIAANNGNPNFRSAVPNQPTRGETGGCLQMASSNGQISGIEVQYCDGVGIAVQGGNNVITQCNVHDSTVGVQLAGSTNQLGPQNSLSQISDTAVEVLGTSQVTGNIFSNAGIGVHIQAPGQGSQISQNQFTQQGVGVLVDPHTAGVAVWFNTLVGGNNGIVAAAASQVDLRDTVVMGMRGYPVVGSPTVCDYNDFFQNNQAVACSGTHNLAVDPQFSAGACGAYSIGPTSPLAHAGIAVSGSSSSSSEAAPSIGACSLP